MIGSEINSGIDSEITMAINSGILKQKVILRERETEIHLDSKKD